MQPAVVVDGLFGLLRHIAVAVGDDAAANEQFAITVEADLHTIDGPADRSRPGFVEFGEGAHTGGLRHAPDLADRETQAEQEFQGLRRNRGGAGGRDLQFVQTESGAQFRQHQRLGDPVLHRQQRPAAAAGEASTGAGHADADCPLCQRFLDRTRLRGHGGIDTGLDLLPHPRHTEEDGRPGIGKGRGDLSCVGYAREGEAGEQIQAMRRDAVGDMRGR